ncbi:MAG: immunoglobulin domain-containing protein [Opitutae bacterium]|nr:immunoglobulin domain-containing protein [Opitutae bacterium]
MKKHPLLFAVLLALTTLLAGFTFIINSNTGLPLKWPPGSIPFRVTLGSSSTLSDGTNYNTSFQAAADSWNPLLGNVQLTTQVLASGTGADGNRINEITFSDTIYGDPFETNTLAVTTVWHRGNDRAESDIIFNTKWTWDSYRGIRRANLVDLRRVAIHELGHSLGLDHPDEGGQTVAAIMNSHVSNIDAQTSDDIDGAQQLYGPPGIPANDNFASAIALTLANNAVTATGFNTNATKETNEPSHAGDRGGRSVWWKWTAPADGSVTLDTRGSRFDTTLGVYTGTSVGSLATIASNDDIDRGVVQASTVTFTVGNGTTYLIAVDGFDGDCAGITLNLVFTPVGGSAPTITTQPTSLTVTAGANVTFTVAATGTGTLTYQWHFNGNPISGATSASYSLTSVQQVNAGNYSVTVSNSAGTATSTTATLTVNPATTIPSFTTQPASQTVTAGANVTFTVEVAGNPTPTLQWFFGSTAIPGATSTTYTITNAQAGSAGNYSVTAVNTAGSGVSNTATLTVNQPPPPAPPPSSGGGGGGGAPSLWFVGALALLAVRRGLRRE